MNLVVLSKDNIKELNGKEPIIVFCSLCGAMGCSGLIFVTLKDKTYAYSLFSKDEELIYDFCEMVPASSEITGINRNNKLIPTKRTINNLYFEDIGYGNSCYLDKKIQKEYKKMLKGDYPPSAHNEIVKKYTNKSMPEIYDFVMGKLKI